MTPFAPVSYKGNQNSTVSASVSQTTPLSQQALAQILSSLQSGETLSVQVLRSLSENIALFQTSLGTLNLNVTNASTLKAGSNWQLSSDQSGQTLQLTTAVQPTENLSAGQTTLTASLAKHLQNLENSTNLISSGISENTANTGNAKTSDPQLQTILNMQRLEAAIQQNSPAALYSTLAALAGRQFKDLPQTAEGQAIEKLTQQILDLRLSEKVTAEQLQKAIAGSGIFHEARQDQSIKNQSTNALSSLSTLINASDILALDADALENADLKFLLSALRSLTKQISGETPPPSGAKSQILAPPPERNSPLQGQKPSSEINPNDAQDFLLAKLGDQTNQALARLKLLQLASLPDEDSAAMQSQSNTHQASGTHTSGSLNEQTRVHLNFEVPLALAAGQTAILALRVTEDNAGAKNAEEKEKGWQVDFALETDETGALEAQVTLNSQTLGITLWANKKEFADHLKEGADAFQAKLNHEGFDIRQFRIIHGKRPSLTHYAALRNGRFMDQIS